MDTGLLNDHTGKRSNSRAISWVASLVLCGIAIGVVFMPNTQEPSMYLLGALVTMALGPIGINRGFGERGRHDSGK